MEHQRTDKVILGGILPPAPLYTLQNMDLEEQTRPDRLPCPHWFDFDFQRQSPGLTDHSDDQKPDKCMMAKARVVRRLLEEVNQMEASHWTLMIEIYYHHHHRLQPLHIITMTYQW